MTLPNQIVDREYQKFVDVAPGQTAVRVTGQNFSGSFSVSGLKVGGLHSVVTLNSATWTALPATPLANRNAIAIQNESSTLVKVNFNGAASGFVGMSIFPNGGERQYDITEDILIYAKCQSGSVDVTIEEIA
jgi:hypothetical protein